MLLEKLPMELLLDIIEACSLATLAIIARTCRYLHNVVTPILYRDLHVVYSHRSTLLLRTLVDSPHLAKFVRSYCRAGAVSSCPCANALAKKLGHTVPGMQFRALHNASNLTSLEIRVALTSPYFEEAKSRVSFLLDGTVQLRRLAIHPVSKEIAEEALWSSVIHEVLKAQPLLEELALPNKRTWNSPEYTLERDALPKLTSLLSGAKGTFEAILPDRPGITSLGFHQMALAKIAEDVLPLVPDTKLITEVTWRATGENPDLSLFAQAFPSLRVLRFRYTSSAFELFMTQVSTDHLYAGFLAHSPALGPSGSPPRNAQSARIGSWRLLWLLPPQWRNGTSSFLSQMVGYSQGSCNFGRQVSSSLELF